MFKESKNDVLFKLLITIFALIIAFLYNNAVGQVCQVQQANNDIWKYIQSIVFLYEIKQIFCSALFFMWGYIVVSIVLEKMQFLLRCALAIPVAVALWDIISVMVLICNITYNNVVMSVICLLISIIICIKRLNSFKKILSVDLFFLFVIVFAVCTVLASGVPFFMTGNDYFGCVMEYGQIIVETQGLAYENLGNFVYAIGIGMALMSAWAAMMGFETIIVIHFLMILSFVIALYLVTKRILEKNLNYSKYISILTTLIIVTIPPIVALEYWIISNAWVMVYLFFALILLKYFAEKDDQLCIYMIEALLISMVALLRAEGFVFASVLVILMSYLTIGKRGYAVMSIPMVIIEGLWLIKRMMFGFGSEVVLDETDLWITPTVLAVMIVCGVVVSLYVVLYNCTLISYIRNSMPIISLVLLMIGTFLLGVSDLDRFKNNTSCALWNLTHNHWGTFFYAFCLISVVISVIKKDIGFWEMFIFGYGLIAFDICMGREEYLRYGIGDSFDRMIMCIVPICCIYILESLVDIRYELKNNQRLQ